jgi:hypothetical protein
MGIFLVVERMIGIRKCGLKIAEQDVDPGEARYVGATPSGTDYDGLRLRADPRAEGKQFNPSLSACVEAAR